LPATVAERAAHSRGLCRSRLLCLLGVVLKAGTFVGKGVEGRKSQEKTSVVENDEQDVISRTPSLLNNVMDWTLTTPMSNP
jgi:hypothetical protein